MSDNLFPQYQCGLALLAENGHLLQQTGYDRSTGMVERAGNSQQLGWIESSAEASIVNLSGGIKAIGLLIAGRDRSTGNEAAVMEGLAGLQQEVGDGIHTLLNAQLTAAEGQRAALAREAREDANAATHKAARKEAKPC